MAYPFLICLLGSVLGLGLAAHVVGVDRHGGLDLPLRLLEHHQQSITLLLARKSASFLQCFGSA